ncbi:hypothetical protein HDU76_007410 [Blyttiomyces sp. JEL0837]|nr:hypothetical protein HDU76_007410 [Blyttiomyces sp. JEL0837]
MEYIRECLDTGCPFDIEALILDMEDNVDWSPTDTTKDISAIQASEDDLAPKPDDPNTIPLDIDLLIKSKSSSANLLGGSNSSTSARVLVPPPRPKGRIVAVRSMSDCLLSFLESLVEPVVPTSLYMRCVHEGYRNHMAAKQVIKHMPRNHYNVFIYLCAFLREVLQNYVGKDGFTTESLARIFAPVMLRFSSTTSQLTGKETSPTQGAMPSTVSTDVGFGAEVRKFMVLMHFLDLNNAL